MEVTYTIEILANQSTSTEPSQYRIVGVGYGTKRECDEYLERMSFEDIESKED